MKSTRQMKFIYFVKSIYVAHILEIVLLVNWLDFHHITNLEWMKALWVKVSFANFV